MGPSDQSDWLEEGPKLPRHPVFDYKPPPYLKVIRYSLISVVIAALLSLSYTGLWFFGATQLRKAVLGWVEMRRSEGVAVTYDRLELSGFPSSLQVLMTAPKMSRAGFGGQGAESTGGRLEASRFLAQAVPWKFNQFDVDLSGELAASFAHEGKLINYKGAAKRLFSRWIMHGDGLPSAAKIEVKGLGLAHANGKKGAPPQVQVKSLHLTAERVFPGEITHQTPTFSLKLTGKDLRVPEFIPLPLGQDVSDLLVLGKILGELPPSSLVKALSKWRDGGGTVEVKQIRLRHGPLDVLANGTLALDKELQPVGAMTARIRGFFATVDRLRRAGLIRSRDAAMAKLVLGALARRPSGGGPSTVSLPLTIQKGKLYAGPVTLAELPVIDWGGGSTAGDKVKILR